MPSAWVARRATKRGTSYRVMFRTGGRESAPRYAGAFRTMREARIRRDYVAGELAAMRIPDLRVVEPTRPDTFHVIAERWRASRRDVTVRTAENHRVDLARALPVLGA